MKSESIGQRIRRIRQQLGMDLMEFGATVKINHKLIQVWETDKTGLHFYNAIQLCKALNISLDYLAGLTDIPDPRPRPYIEDIRENLQKVKT